MGDGLLLHSIRCYLFTAFAKSLESHRARKTMMMVNRPTLPELYYKFTNFVKALDRSDRLDNDAGSVALKPDLSHNKTRCIVEYQLDTSDDHNKTNILVVSYYHHHYCYHFKYLNRYNDWLSLWLVNITFVKKTNTLVISYEVERDGEESELQVQTWSKKRKQQCGFKYLIWKLLKRSLEGILCISLCRRICRQCPSMSSLS